MSQKVRIDIDVKSLVPSVKEYLSASTLVFLRTWGKIMAYAFCARQAALLGVVRTYMHTSLHA